MDVESLSKETANIMQWSTKIESMNLWRLMIKLISEEAGTHGVKDVLPLDSIQTPIKISATEETTKSVFLPLFYPDSLHHGIF